MANSGYHDQKIEMQLVDDGGVDSSSKWNESDENKSSMQLEQQQQNNETEAKYAHKIMNHMVRYVPFLFFLVSRKNGVPLLKDNAQKMMHCVQEIKRCLSKR